jgi:hypothetical protein
MPDVFPDFTVYRPLEAEPVSGRTYDRTIADYWNFLLSANPNNPVFGNPPALFTRGCYNYRDVQSFEDILRRNLSGVSEESPSIIHSVGIPDPFNPGANIPVFVTVLDTIALTPGVDEVDENGNLVAPQDVLEEENDAVKRGHVRLTIQRQNGGPHPMQRIDVINNHRHRSNLFNLDVPAGSVLADRLERPIDRDTPYPNVIAEGFYVLIKFTNPGDYRIRSRGFGVRDYKSIADYYIRIPPPPPPP